MKINILKNHANILRDFFLDLIFPTNCLGCGQEGAWLCDNCFSRITFKKTQYCLECKQVNQFGEFCPECLPKYYLDGIWIAGDYENKIIQNLIKNLKYRFVKNISLILGNFLSLFLRNLINQARLKPADIKENLNWRRFDVLKNTPNILLNFNQAIIIPVPLHKKRERWRSFNQSQMIAEIVAKKFYRPLINDLKRIKHKKPQAKLSETERQKNILDCFSWQAKNLANHDIILIDDVVTTGSTLNECAKILKQAGAREVWGLVVAKG
ncbi:MAG: phosphoribosyltransferase family protein [Patescibacteria group bacterium]